MIETFGIAPLSPLDGGDACEFRNAARSRTLPRREIASDHALEFVDFREHQFAQARLSRGIERWKLRPAAERDLPGARTLEKVARAVCLFLLEPVHEVTRPF